MSVHSNFARLSPFYVALSLSRFVSFHVACASLHRDFYREKLPEPTGLEPATSAVTEQGFSEGMARFSWHAQNIHTSALC